MTRPGLSRDETIIPRVSFILHRCFQQLSAVKKTQLSTSLTMCFGKPEVGSTLPGYKTKLTCDLPKAYRISLDGELPSYRRRSSIERRLESVPMPLPPPKQTSKYPKRFRNKQGRFWPLQKLYEYSERGISAKEAVFGCLSFWVLSFGHCRLGVAVWVWAEASCLAFIETVVGILLCVNCFASGLL